MKFRNLRTLLLLAFSGFLMVQCTSDPIPGPAGADGIDGIDGLDGVDGEDGTTSCVSCHSNAFREPIILAHSTSAHGSGETWGERGTRESCARCHNNEGFIDILSGLYVDSLGNSIVNPLGYSVGNVLNCNGCHANHRSLDFESDGNDKAVRSIIPVDLFIDPNLTIDFTNSSDEWGLSNLCINCHQPRNSYDIPGPTGDYEITSSRFGPHHSPQSSMLEGILGANISGPTPYPGVGSAAHREGSSCIACHMGPTTDGSDGGHTWHSTENACVQCHPNGAPTELTGFTTDFERLRQLLLAAGSIAADSSTVSGTYPANVAQATWNWRTLLEDQSRGTHNPGYTRALLDNSIDALEE